MSIVNVRIKNLQELYNDKTMNLEKWMSDKNNVYIGRGGVIIFNNKRFPYGNSKWHNPFKIGIDGDRDAVIDKYERYIKSKPELINSLHELKGKNLGCWCYPEKCHGDVLKKLIN